MAERNVIRLTSATCFQWKKMSFLLGGTQSFEDTLKGSFVRAKNNETHEDQICQDMQLKKYS